MKIKIVTAIYSDIHGTDLGGRHSRGGHYRYSLKSLLKMTDADFVCYTSNTEIDDLKDFFYNQNNINQNKLTFKVYNLRKFDLTEKINKIKNIEEVKKSDRCVEIQYSKFVWCNHESLIDDYDIIFWFDAGLSHCGLIPSKYLGNNGYWEKYYESTLFNNKFLHNLINYSGNKIVICAKENLNNFWSQTVPRHYYNIYSMERHIIGGLYGGLKNNMINYCNLFMENINKILDNENILYHEEHIMSLIFYNHNELFNPKYFDIWWHEEDKIPGIDLHEYTKTRKSFYKILEELNV